MIQLYTLTKTKNLTMDILGTPEHQPPITGDVMEFGFPEVGQKFLLANQNGPAESGQERLFVLTSTVTEIVRRFSSGTVFRTDGAYSDHSITFRTKNSEYRLDWREVL